MTFKLMLLAIGIFWQCAFAQTLHTEVILKKHKIHNAGDTNTFASQFAYRDGKIFVVHVEPPIFAPENGLNLLTVLRKGVRQPDGTWSWESRVIEERTIFDPWHTQASIGLDSKGYIHVAYNMHNMPWQYSVSEQPFNISSFKFRGQKISDDQLSAVKFQNKTTFPDIGAAAIAGNQVTYPAFFNDRNNKLYITYRYALRPAREWVNRDYAAGIASYDSQSGQWNQIGGNISISSKDANIPIGKTSAVQKPFLFSSGYTPYHPTLSFDSDNRMHIFWTWRKGGAGADTSHPSYAYSPDGENFFSLAGIALKLPIASSAVETFIYRDNRKFYSPIYAAINENNNPLVIFQPVSGGRELSTLDVESATVKTEETPASSTSILIDKIGRQWTFATGIRVFMRNDEKSSWNFMGSIDNDLCSPKAKYYPSESRFIIHAKSCSTGDVSIFSFRR